MGVVYKAEDTKLKRTVALKFLSAEALGSEEDKERFAQEAQAAAALTHPNICTIHEIDDVDGETFIVMEFVEGQSLKDKICSGPLKLGDALDVAAQVAEALRKAHDRGITHRDIKPSNIIVTSDGVAKILDFGLAVLAGQPASAGTSAISGTAAYMSPEQVRGEEVDRRADIWALGVVLYEMLAAERPFKGDYESAVIYSLLNELPPAISSLRDDVPEAVGAVVERALAKDRDKRYQDMEDFLVALRSARDREYARGWQQLLYGVEASKKSIAVLPFTSFSESKEDEFFSDGTTEDIILQLSKIAQLRVISRTSIMRYKHTDKSLREIGRELNVAAVLEGSVRRSGDRVRIVAQLVDAETDEHLWAETYDREMKDIFSIQSDVAEKIADALRAELSASEKGRIAREPTANTQAYEYYLKGREYYYRYRKHDNLTAIALFRRALDLDPDYALAWAGVADAYAQGFERFGMPTSWSDCALEAGEKAVALDPGSAEAHKALGIAYDVKAFFKKALEAYLKAAELNPNHYPAVLNVGGAYLYFGEFDKALPWLRRAFVIDPVSALMAPFLIGDTWRQLGEFARARDWLKKALELQPGLGTASFSQAALWLLQGDDERANEQMNAAVAHNPDDPRVHEFAGMIAEFTGDLARAREHYRRSIDINPAFETDWLSVGGIGLGHILMKEGKLDESRRLLDKARDLREEQIRRGDESFNTRYGMARIHAIEGDKTAACAWLKKAIEFGWRDYRMALRDPWLENLRGEEGFTRLMAETKAKLDEMKARVQTE